MPFRRLVPLLLAVATPAAAQPFLDPTFSFDGKLTLAVDAPGSTRRDHGRQVVALGGGGYIVVGEADLSHPDPFRVAILMQRLGEDGETDPDYAVNGRNVKDAGLTSVTDAARASNDYILVTGSFGGDSALVRFRPDGLEDPAFAGDGGTAWDASGVGQPDVPTAVEQVAGLYFVGGHFDADPTDAIESDVYVASVDRTTGAATVFARDELGGADGANDRIRDIVIADVGSGPGRTLAVLADNGSPDYAGTVTIFDAATTARLRTIRLEDVLTAPGCDAEASDPRSSALVRLNNQYGAVVGNLVTAQFVFRQVYVVIYDFKAGTVVSATCGPLGVPGLVEQGIARVGRPELQVMHLALASFDRLGYWRWAPDFVDGVPTYRPDARYNDGMPIFVGFETAPGIAPSVLHGAVARDARDRAVVLGSARYNLTDTLDDYDIALFRVHASETVFADAFETD